MSSEQIPQKMRSAVIKDFKQGYEVKDIDVPVDLGPNDILVKIAAAGYCHTDLQVMEGVYASAGAKPGLVGSHEPAGTVVKAGSDAGKSGINLGDRVGSINTYGYCGKCNACKVGQQLCENLPGMLGLTINGGFSQYMKADARVVSKIPDSIPWTEAAPLFCAGATVYGAIKAVDLQPGDVVAMVGIGGLGHLGVQYAKAIGCKVIAIDNRPEGIDVANNLCPQGLQADESYVVDTEEAQNKCIEKLQTSFYDSNPGVDKVVINAEARPLIRFSQQFLRKGGVLCDVGLPADGPLEVDPFALNFKEQTVKGYLICTPDQCQEMINLHAKHGCKTHIEKTYRVEEINEMMEHYNRKDLKGRLCMVF